MKTKTRILVNQINKLTTRLEGELEVLENGTGDCNCDKKKYFPMLEFDKLVEDCYIKWVCINCGGARVFNRGKDND